MKRIDAFAVKSCGKAAAVVSNPSSPSHLPHIGSDRQASVQDKKNLAALDRQ